MTLSAEADQQRTQSEPVLSGQRTLGPHILVYLFVLAPMLALIVAVPIGLSPRSTL